MSQGQWLVIPYVIEQSSRGERTMDIYSRLLNDRLVFLGAPIDDQVANVVMAQLLHLDAEDPERDINLYINSPGGSVHAGMAIYDTMQFVECDVATTALGMLGIEMQKLRHDYVCDLIVDGSTQKDDPVIQEPRVDVHGSLAPGTLLYHVRDDQPLALTHNFSSFPKRPTRLL